MDKKALIFEKISRDYLKQIGSLNLQALAEKIGAEIEKNQIIIPFFGSPHKIFPGGIIDQWGNEPIHSVKVVLCKYLLLYPSFIPEGDDWVSYKDFRDTAPFVGGFQNNAERALAGNFTGKLKELKRASLCLGGFPPNFDWNYQLMMKFDSLPQVPIILLFNDADEEFPAQCLFLFERRAEKYLDAECLAIIGWLLADYLSQSLPNHGTTTIM